MLGLKCLIQNVVVDFNASIKIHYQIDCSSKTNDFKGYSYYGLCIILIAL